MEKFEAVRCEECKVIFDASSREFIHVEGAIYQGMSGGILGGEPEGDKPHSSIYCPTCFRKIINKHFASPKVLRDKDYPKEF